MYIVKLLDTRGVTIYRYIAIHKEYILYRNTKCVLQYIAIFPYIKLDSLFFIQFLSCNSCKSRRCMPVTFIPLLKVFIQSCIHVHVYNSDSVTKGSKLKRGIIIYNVEKRM